jgi:hypothetical protein
VEDLRLLQSPSKYYIKSKIYNHQFSDETNLNLQNREGKDGEANEEDKKM